MSIWILCKSKSYDMKKLKAGRTPLTPEERAAVIKAGAVWHHAQHKGEPSAAVWKTKQKDGSFLYCCNTHRAIAIKKTLKGAIAAFKFIKTTA